MGCAVYCLHCGDCCKRISPVTGNGEPCPHIKETGTFVFCSTYEQRPEQCRRHSFPARFCPIGLDTLKLTEVDDIQLRLEKGWELLTKGY